MDLENLLEKMRQGDESAFEEFYQKTYHLVYFHTKKYLKNEEDAQEVVQDVYLSVFQSVDRLQNVESWKSWLGGIVHNLAIKKATRGQHPEVSLDDEIAENLLPADFSAEPGSQLDQRETQRLVGEMIDKLPTAQRVTLTLYYFDEFKTAEIAQIMGCSEGTVKSRLNYARKSIEKQTEELEKKQGVKLYSITPVLLLAALRCQWDGMSVAIPAMSTVLQSGVAAAEAAAGSASTSAAASTAGTAAAATASKAAVTGAAAGAAKAVGAKIIAGVLAAVIAIGAGGYAVHRITAQDTSEAPAQSETKRHADSEQTLPAEVSSEPEPAVPGYYAAYREIVNEYIAQYGPGGVRQSQSGLIPLVGVCIVRLIDFDLDGTEELFLIYGERYTATGMEDYCAYSYAIWTSLDGTAADKLCENPISFGEQAYCPMLELVTKPDGIYLSEEPDHPEGPCHVYRRVTAEGLSDVLTLLCIDFYVRDSEYYVNGVSESLDRYVAAREDFLADGTVTRFNLTSWSYPDTSTTDEEALRDFAKLLEETDQTLQLLGIELSDEQNSAAAPGETSYEAYLEIVDDLLEQYGSGGYGNPKYTIPELTGLCVVRLEDFNRDGIEELLVVYLESMSEDSNYTCAVWSQQEGRAVLVEEASLPGSTREPHIILQRNDEQTYLIYSYVTSQNTVGTTEYAGGAKAFDGSRFSAAFGNTGEMETIELTGWIFRFSDDAEMENNFRTILSQTEETINMLRG